MRSAMSCSVIRVWLFLAAISAPTLVWGARIVDIHGDPVRQGVPYFIVPARVGSGGGVFPLTESSNVSICPPDVAQAHRSSDLGYRVYFSSSGQHCIQTTDRIRIEFGAGDWNCTESKIWRIRICPGCGTAYVSTGGAAEKPDSQFGIHVEGRAYKIVNFPGESSDQFSNVGVFTDPRNVRRLILSNRPLLVRFKPAPIPKRDDYAETVLETFPLSIE